MSIEVEVSCSECGRQVDEEDILCPSCARKEYYSNEDVDAYDLLKKLAPFVAEATLKQAVEISGELAFEIQQALRVMEK